MTKHLLTIAIIAATFSSCVNEPKVEQDAPTSTTTQTQAKTCKTLIVIGDDRSGSTGAIRKLSADDYKQVAQCLNNNGSGTLAVEIIGNAKGDSRQSFPLHFDSPKPHVVQTKPDPTLSEDEAVNTQNKAIDKENEIIKANNLAKIDSYIQTLTDKVINYTPANGDHTDINDALSHINTVINEPTYADYDKIIVALFCDGINQPHSSKVEPITSKLECSKPYTIYTIGWSDQSCFVNCSDKAAFDNKENFIEIIKKLSCN